MKRIYAPIDNKNLMEDSFEDAVFSGFYWAPDHRTRSNRRHLIGSVKTENYDAMVDVKWCWGDHSIEIRVIAIQPTEDADEVRREVFDHYEQLFKSWQCEDNENLVVDSYSILDILTVSFYYKDER